MRLRRCAGVGTVLLDDVSLAINVGESAAVVGPPGAGKSLLLRALALLDSLDGGEIQFWGEPIAARDVPAYRRKVLYVQQRPSLSEGTVRENLMLPFIWKVAGAAHQHLTPTVRNNGILVGL